MNLRKFAIDVAGASPADRRLVRDMLKTLGEPVFSESRAFDGELFDYIAYGSSGVWLGRLTPANKAVISMEAFLAGGYSVTVDFRQLTEELYH